MITTPALSMDVILTALIATGQPLDGLTWRLYSNNVPITPQTMLSDLTEAAFGGYSPVVGSSWGTPFQDVNGNGIVIGGNAQFRMTDLSNPQTLYGYYATKGASTSETLVFVEPFGTGAGIALGIAGQGITVQQTYALPGPVSAEVVGP